MIGILISAVNACLCVAYLFYPTLNVSVQILSGLTIAIGTFRVASFIATEKTYGIGAYLNRFAMINSVKMVVVYYSCLILLYFVPFFLLYIKGHIALSIMFLVLGLINLHWTLRYQYQIKPLMEKYNNIIN